jgi:hypothetical protein
MDDHEDDAEPNFRVDYGTIVSCHMMNPDGHPDRGISSGPAILP